jgi:hypothetical protein
MLKKPEDAPLEFPHDSGHTPATQMLVFTRRAERS